MTSSSSLYGTPPNQDVSSTNSTSLYGGAGTPIPDASGNVVVRGDLIVLSGNILTTATTGNIFPTNATTINLGASATALNLGAGTGTTTVNNDLTVLGTFSGSGSTLGNIIVGSLSYPNTITTTTNNLILDSSTNLVQVAANAQVTGALEVVGAVNTTTIQGLTGGAAPTGGLNLYSNDATRAIHLYDNLLQIVGGAYDWAFNADGTTTFPSYSFPYADGTANQVLITDGAGVLSFANVQSLDTNYTYTASSVAGGANLNLIGSDATTNTIKLTNAGHITAVYTSATAVTLGSDATDANTASTIVARDASGNFSAGTITATLSGTATQVSNSLTAGTHLSGGPFNGSSAVTLSTDATNANTASTIIARDASGNFSAGTGSFTGVQFNGATSGSVTIAAPATAGSQSYTLPTALPAVTGYVLSGTTGGALSWVPNPDVNTTYDFNATSTSGGANLNLVGSDSTTDTVKLANGGHITAVYASGTEVTLGSDATNVNTASTIVARDASGRFSADGATLGNVTIGGADQSLITTSAGDLKLDSFTGNIYVDNATLTTGSGNAFVFNDAATTTADAFKSATTITIGQTTGTTTVRNAVVVGGNLTVNGTTVNVAQAATIAYNENNLRANRPQVQSTSGDSTGFRVLAPNATTSASGETIAFGSNDIDNGEFISLRASGSTTAPFSLRTGKYTAGVFGASTKSISIVDATTTYATINPAGPTVSTDLTTKSYVDALAPGGVTSVTGGTHVTASPTTGAVIVTTDATNANTASTIVARDASGNFSAGTVTANLANNSYVLGALEATTNSAYTFPSPVLTTVTNNNGLDVASSMPAGTNGNAAQQQIAQYFGDTGAGNNTSATFVLRTANGNSVTGGNVPYTGVAQTAASAVILNNTMGTINYNGYATTGFGDSIASSGQGGGFNANHALQIQGLVAETFADGTLSVTPTAVTRTASANLSSVAVSGTRGQITFTSQATPAIGQAMLVTGTNTGTSTGIVAGTYYLIAATGTTGCTLSATPGGDPLTTTAGTTTGLTFARRFITVTWTALGYIPFGLNAKITIANITGVTDGTYMAVGTSTTTSVNIGVVTTSVALGSGPTLTCPTVTAMGAGLRIRAMPLATPANSGNRVEIVNHNATTATYRADTFAISSAAYGTTGITKLTVDTTKITSTVPVVFPSYLAAAVNNTLATTNATGTGAVVTLTFAALASAPYSVGSSIVVANIISAGYNGTFTVTACTTTTVSYASTATGGYASSGTIKLNAGAIGQQLCIIDSVSGGNPNGMMAFWDTSNSRWSYIHDNSAV